MDEYFLNTFGIDFKTFCLAYQGCYVKFYRYNLICKAYLINFDLMEKELTFEVLWTGDDRATTINLKWPCNDNEHCLNLKEGEKAKWSIYKEEF